MKPPRRASGWAGHCWRFWQRRGLLTEGADWLRRLLAVPGVDAHPKELARALEAAGGVAYWRAEMPAAMTYYESSLAMRRRTGDPAAIANALYNVGFPNLVNKQDIPKSMASFQESLAIYRELGDRERIARVLWGLGNAYYFSEQNEAARDALIEEVEMLLGMTDLFSLAWAQHTLGLAYNRLGEAATRSAPLWRRALEHFAAVGDVSGITILLGDFALLAVANGDKLRFTRLMAASEHLAEQVGAQLGIVTTIDDARPDLSALDPAAVRMAIDEGLRMTVDEAVAYALNGESSR